MTAKQPGRVFTVAFTPNGRLLAAAGDDGIIRVFDVESQQLTRLLKGHQKPVNQLIISPDGQTVMSASDDHTARIWMIRTGRTMRTLAAHDDEVWALALHPDGKTLATGCKDGTLRLWDVYSGKRIENAFGDARGIIAMAFSPDGRELLTAGGNQAGILWDLTRPSWRPPIISRPVQVVEPTPDPSWPEERKLVEHARYLMDYGHDNLGARSAQPLLEQAIRTNPKYPVLARRAYETALELEPKHDEAKRALDQLK